MKKLFFCYFLFIISNSLLANKNSVITKEYFSDGKIRRTLSYDEKLNLDYEIYYHRSNSLQIAKIEYQSGNAFKVVTFFGDNGTKILYQIDFVKGIYQDFRNKITLLFKDNFVFNGKQSGNKIISYYNNGKRQGPVLQFDSTATGKIKSNIAFRQYEYTQINGRVYITGTSLHPIYNDTFTIYKGIYCDFLEDVLDGEANIYFLNGKKKVQSLFKKGTCSYYNSYDKQGNTISKITGVNGLINNKVIINGSIKDLNDKNLIWFFSLGKVGKIYSTYQSLETSSRNKDNESEKYSENSIKSNLYLNFKQISDSNKVWNTGQQISLKIKFDSELLPINNISEFRMLLGIPYYYFQRYDFDEYDKDDFEIVKIDNNCIVDSLGLHTPTYLINERDSLKYIRNCFFTSSDYHTWDRNWIKISRFPNDDAEDVLDKTKDYHFKLWLKNSLHLEYIGQGDFFPESENDNNFETINKNENIVSFLKSYSNSILLNCVKVFREKTLTQSTFTNPLFSCNLDFKNIYLSSVFGNVGFEISNKDYTFYIKEETVSSNEYYITFNLLDKRYGVRYTIKFEFVDAMNVLEEVKRDDNWKFQIVDLNNSILYNVNKDGESVKNFSNDLTKSLEKIFLTFGN